ncbi:MAG: ATP synthase F1 subunit gamma [Candidatus Staskawiczbacteria bacterium]|nr:ATP synthase F1 subunit gamma [Candidatus Staskawiczbacteria bacterium]
MESPQNIKKRLKSVSNIGKITKAMELVAATKMRKSQEIALSSRPYAFAALDFLATISSLDQKLPELFKKRIVKKVLFVVVSSDKGLAGAFNSSVFRKFEMHQKSEREEWKNENHFYITIGEKAFNHLTKKGFNVLKKFTSVGDYTTTEQVFPVTDFIVKGYLEYKWDRVIVVSTHFRSALKQEPHVRRVLPVDYEHIRETIQQIIPERGKFAELMKEHQITFVPDKLKIKQYKIEPSPEEVLNRLAEHLFSMQFYHLILEANASEHSARRMAMKTASDNASDLGNALNLQYNKSRQSRITTEISEISAGAEALN